MGRSNGSQPPRLGTHQSTSSLAVASEAASLSSSRPQRQKILSSFLLMLKEQRSQVEDLLSERNFLEEYIKRQHTRWHSKMGCLRSQLSQMEKMQDMEKSAQEAKMELLLELMRRDMLFYKDQFENSEKDLEDFLVYIGTLGQKIIDLGKKTADDSAKTVEDHKEDKYKTVKLETEMKKMKNAHKKLISKKDSEISALLAEKDFIWHQFKNLDEDCTDLRKSKHLELVQAHANIEKLQTTIEKLQSSVTEKDETIARLRANLSGAEFELRKCSKEKELANEKLAKVKTDIDELRRSENEKSGRNAKSRTHQSNIDKPKGSSKILRGNSKPMAKKSRAVWHRKNFSNSESGNAHVLQEQICLSNGSHGYQASSAPHALQRCTRARERSFATPESPKLFSSRFKVPKLKDLKPQIGADATD